MWNGEIGAECPPCMMGKCGEKEKEKAKKKGKDKTKGDADKKTPKKQRSNASSMETDAPKPSDKRAPSPVKMVGYLSYGYLCELITIRAEAQPLLQD